MFKRSGNIVQKNEKQEIDEEENEPCLRALYKKTRYLNKKIIEISDLEKKNGPLKPQQIQKVNKKEQIMADKLKYQEMAVFYKEILLQNAQHYKRNQMVELKNMANAIAVANLSKQFKDNDCLQNLIKLLTEVPNKTTIDRRAEQISNSFIKIAEDNKLQKKIFEYKKKHGNKIQDMTIDDVINQEKIVNDICEENIQKKIETQIIFSSKRQEKQVQNKLIVNEKPEDKVLKKQELTVKSQIEDIKRQDQLVQDNLKIHNPVENIVQENGLSDKQNHTKKVNKKKVYKPKYQKKKQEIQNQQERQQSEDSDLQARPRQFRKDEINKLKEQGFIVVEKRHPKDRNQKKEYERQHGKKQDSYNHTLHPKHKS